MTCLQLGAQSSETHAAYGRNARFRCSSRMLRLAGFLATVPCHSTCIKNVTKPGQNTSRDRKLVSSLSNSFQNILFPRVCLSMNDCIPLLKKKKAFNAFENSMETFRSCSGFRPSLLPSSNSALHRLVFFGSSYSRSLNGL